MDDPRVLICGSRRWLWPDTVTAVLDRLNSRHLDRLVVVETASTGAGSAAHRWCERQGLPRWRHLCHSDSRPGRRTIEAGPSWRPGQRNQRMLTDEEPRLAIAFHECFTPGSGSTSDACLRALVLGIPVWLVPTEDPDRGLWLRLDQFPPAQIDLVYSQLARTQRHPA